jgi:type II secretory pathway predicted ATPase ExeA
LRRVDADLTIGLISNAQGNRGDLLRWMLNSLNVVCNPQADYVMLFQQFQDFVVAEYAAGRHVVLIVDEAQNLGSDTLEELRMLTNINSGKDELLHIILVGQPELRDLICQPQLRQFAQRVTAVYHLEPMDLATARDYIRHRLLHAGGSGDEISSAAVEVIHAESKGIARMINKICDLALVYAASAEYACVDSDIMQELIRDGLILKSLDASFSSHFTISAKAAE